MVARKSRDAVVKLKIKKNMLRILAFIQIIYLNQQSILRCFSRLKFEKSLFSKQYVFSFKFHF